jgi:hypothetical protein
MYDRILGQALINSNSRLIEEILQAETVAFRLLHLLELAVAANLPNEYRLNKEYIKDYVLQCVSFLSIQRDSD